MQIRWAQLDSFYMSVLERREHPPSSAISHLWKDGEYYLICLQQKWSKQNLVDPQTPRGGGAIYITENNSTPRKEMLLPKIMCLNPNLQRPHHQNWHCTKQSSRVIQTSANALRYGRTWMKLYQIAGVKVMRNTFTIIRNRTYPLRIYNICVGGRISL